MEIVPATSGAWTATTSALSRRSPATAGGRLQPYPCPTAPNASAIESRRQMHSSTTRARAVSPTEGESSDTPNAWIPLAACAATTRTAMSGGTAYRSAERGRPTYSWPNPGQRNERKAAVGGERRGGTVVRVSGASKASVSLPVGAGPTVSTKLRKDAPLASVRRARIPRQALPGRHEPGRGRYQGR